MATFPQWEYDLLKALGAPASQANLTALNLWAQSEGSVTNNPLATSGKGAGATTCVAQCGTTSPIYEYDTEANGVAQMARFLKGSYYTKIVAALVGDQGEAAIWSAVNGSPWCKGCQGGQYPVDLGKAVGGQPQATSASVGAGGQANPGSPAGTSPGSGLSQCVISFPGFLFFSGPCILTKGGVKWLSGVAALMAGTGIAAFGIVALAAWGFGHTGAGRAVTQVAGTVGGPIGGAVRTAASGSSSSSGPKRSSSSSSSPTRSTRPAPRAAAPSPEPDTEPAPAGRVESRRIERRFRETERQQGPIGPRGGNPTATRVAQRERRGTSSPGPGSGQRTAAQRQRDRERAQRPF